MRVRHIVAVPMLAAGLLLPLAGVAQAAEDRDCADFATQAEAQAALTTGDPERLDADHDGIACENLIPGGSESVAPVGGVAAGDGSTSGPGALPFVVSGIALTAAGGAAFAARRAARG